MKQLPFIGIVSFAISFISQADAFGQGNASESESSLFGKNSTALGNDPLNNSGNFNNNISNTENPEPEENFGLEGNNELFLEDNANSGLPAQQGSAPAQQGSAPAQNPTPSMQSTTPLPLNAPATNNTTQPSSNQLNTSGAANPENQLQSAPLQNEFVDPFAPAPGQNTTSPDFEALSPESNTPAVDPLGSIDAMPVPSSGQSSTEQPTPRAENGLEAPQTAGAMPPQEPEPKVNGMTASEKELILQRIFELKPREPGTYPEEYIVQPGDTLWDISDQLLGDPFWWPKLWSFNPNIMNPHLIEPGMKIIFEPSNGLLPPALAISDQGNYIPTEVSSKTFSPDRNALADSWRELDGAFVSAAEIPDFNLVDFYGNKTVESRNFVQLPGFISSAAPPTLGRISDLTGQGIAPVRGGFVYSDSNSGLAAKPGDRFVTIRPQAAAADMTGKKLSGQFWAYTGVIGAVRAERLGRVKFLVESSALGVRAGDLIVPYENLLKPVNTSTSGPRVQSDAVVAAIGDGERAFAGLYDVVQLVGPNNTAPVLRVGDLVRIQSNPGGLPAYDEDVDFTPAGLLRVISLGPEAAAAVVVKVNQEIVVGSSAAAE